MSLTPFWMLNNEFTVFIYCLFEWSVIYLASPCPLRSPVLFRRKTARYMGFYRLPATFFLLLCLYLILVVVTHINGKRSVFFIRKCCDSRFDDITKVLPHVTNWVHINPQSNRDMCGKKYISHPPSEINNHYQTINGLNYRVTVFPQCKQPRPFYRMKSFKEHFEEVNVLQLNTLHTTAFLLSRYAINVILIPTPGKVYHLLRRQYYTPKYE